MDSTGLSTEGLSVEVEREIRVGALRYCNVATIGDAVMRALGGSVLPAPGRVLAATATATATATASAAASGSVVVGATTLLAWRSPTETLVLCPVGSSGVFDAVAAALEGMLDACFVDQSGGIWVLRLRGPRVADLLRRLGATTAVPGLGECRIGRLAEITVASLAVREGEVLLLVERLYADHLLGWIRETIADF
jgi:heterotetrameric sarcosine oxidase gamma subunit